MQNYTIIKNPRIDPNDFTITKNCDYCTSYINQVILLPKTNKYICKSCLHNLITALDKNMLDEFKRS